VAAILDGNVKRVFARVFGIDGYPGSKPVEDLMWRRANALLPADDIAAYTQGLMDLGATICTRGKPDCTACPLQPRCVAFAQGRTAELPVRKPKMQQKYKHATMLILIHEHQVLLERRPDQGIWGGLLSLPELEGMRESGAEPVMTDVASLPGLPALLQRFGSAGAARELPGIEHVFTHFKLTIRPLLFELHSKRLSVAEDNYVWLPLSDVGTAGLPAPVKNLLLALTRE